MPKSFRLLKMITSENAACEAKFKTFFNGKVFIRSGNNHIFIFHHF